MSNVNDHRRKGSVLFRVRDKHLYHSFGSLDLDELFLHLDTFKGFASDQKTQAKGLYRQKGQLCANVGLAGEYG
jgi:hypothetical protein